MAEVLVRAVNDVRTDYSNPDWDYEYMDRMRYYRGWPVVVQPDGHEWGRKEGLPNFVVIKVPGISVEKVSKYTGMWRDSQGKNYGRRKWKIRIDDMPQAAINKLKSTGELVIRAGSYAGSYDYTWQQVKSFFRDMKNNVDETEDV